MKQMMHYYKIKQNNIVHRAIAVEYKFAENTAFAEAADKYYMFTATQLFIFDAGNNSEMTKILIHVCRNSLMLSEFAATLELFVEIRLCSRSLQRP